MFINYIALFYLGLQTLWVKLNIKIFNHTKNKKVAGMNEPPVIKAACGKKKKIK